MPFGFEKSIVLKLSKNWMIRKYYFIWDFHAKKPGLISSVNICMKEVNLIEGFFISYWNTTSSCVPKRLAILRFIIALLAQKRSDFVFQFITISKPLGLDKENSFHLLILCTLIFVALIWFVTFWTRYINKTACCIKWRNLTT